MSNHMTDFQQSILGILRKSIDGTLDAYSIGMALPQWKNSKGHAGIVTQVQNAMFKLEDAGLVVVWKPSGADRFTTFFATLKDFGGNE